MLISILNRTTILKISYKGSYFEHNKVIKMVGRNQIYHEALRVCWILSLPTVFDHLIKTDSLIFLIESQRVFKNHELLLMITLTFECVLFYNFDDENAWITR